MIALPRPHGLAPAILAAAFALTAASPAPHLRAGAASAGLSARSRGFEANAGQIDRSAQGGLWKDTSPDPAERLTGDHLARSPNRSLAA